MSAKEFKIPRYRIVKESPKCYVLVPNKAAENLKTSIGRQSHSRQAQTPAVGSKNNHPEDPLKSPGSSIYVKHPQADVNPPMPLPKTLSQPLVPKRLKFRLHSACGRSGSGKGSPDIKTIPIEENNFKNLMRLFGDDPSQLQTARRNEIRPISSNPNKKLASQSKKDLRTSDLQEYISVKDGHKQLDLGKQLHKVSSDSPRGYQRPLSQTPARRSQSPSEQNKQTQSKPRIFSFATGVAPSETQDQLQLDRPPSPYSRKKTAREYESPWTMDGLLKLKSEVGSTWVHGLKKSASQLQVHHLNKDKERLGPLYLKDKYYLKDMSAILKLRGSCGIPISIKIKEIVSSSLETLRLLHSSHPLVQRIKNRFETGDKEYKVTYSPSSLELPRKVHEQVQPHPRPPLCAGLHHSPEAQLERQRGEEPSKNPQLHR